MQNQYYYKNYIGPLLGDVFGDVFGDVLKNRVAGFAGIPIASIEEPNNGDAFVINECNQIELQGVVKIKNLKAKDKNGFKVENNRLSIDCTELIKHCKVLESDSTIPYLSLEGGIIDGNLVLEGGLKLIEFFSSLNQMVMIDSNNNLFTRKIPDPIDPTITSLKADSDGSNITLPDFKENLSLDNVDNTPDTGKPISTQQQLALNLKTNIDGSNITLPGFKENLSLGNLDNTPDTDKPISTQQQLALNGKANTDGSNVFVTQMKTNLLLNNVDNTPDADKAISTQQQLALNLKADIDNTLFLVGDQNISGVKDFKKTVSGQYPTEDDHWSTKEYVEEVVLLSLYSNQTDNVNDYKEKIELLSGTTPSVLSRYNYNLLLTRISNATNNNLPDFIVHPDFSFNLLTGSSVGFYNAGISNTSNGTLNNFTADWTKKDPINFRPNIAITNRNIVLDAGTYQIADTDSITYNYWVTNNTITANDGYIFGNTSLGGQCSPRHSGSSLRVSRHDAEVLGVFTHTASTTIPAMFTFTYNPVDRLYRAYKNGIELYVLPINLGSAGELDGDGRLRLVAGKEFTTGGLKVGNNSLNTQSFNGKLYEGFVARDYVASPAEILALFNSQKKQYGL